MIKLPNRGIVEILGPDAAAFMNNLVTNEIAKMANKTARFCGLLTPQGKYLFDIFAYRHDDKTFLLDSNHSEELVQKLKIYKMRAAIEIMPRHDLAVFAAFPAPCHPALDAGSYAANDYISFTDPRDSAMGLRIFAPQNTPETASFSRYESHRLQLGIPDLAQDLIRDKDFALEGLMDELHAIDFHKGCYVGQEMTSRMKRRGTLKQKLCRIKIASSQIPFDTPIMAGETEIGRIRSNNSTLGMALIRFDRWQHAMDAKQNLLANGVEIIIDPPEWLSGANA
ncbi:MAG: glycine cleavage T protein (aminomethyl transferase) [Hyphomonadaceae bacterium]|nr:MAG: glycine cleavage T protein (aminomethyl transferase) [Hyphomonadaceae bacterium]